MSIRWVETEEIRPRWRFNGSVRLSETLRVGAEFNAAAGEWSPTANWILQTELENRPMISIGTSSDRIFSPPHRQAYFGTVAKSLHGTNLAPYVSLSYSEWEKGLLVPFGINWQATPKAGILFMNDGRKSHILLNFSEERRTYSLLWVDQRYLGFSTSFAF